MQHQLKDGSWSEVRRATAEDRHLLLAYYKVFVSAEAPWYPLMPTEDADLGNWLTWGGYLDTVKNIHWIALRDNRVVAHQFVARNDNPRIGLCGLGSLYITIAPDCRGLGLGTMMAFLWGDGPFETALREAGVRRVVGHIFPENTKVYTIVRRIGLQFEGVLRQHILGRDGQYHDVLVFGRLVSPAPPCPGCEQQAGHLRIAELAWES